MTAEILFAKMLSYKISHDHPFVSQDYVPNYRPLEDPFLVEFRNVFFSSCCCERGDTTSTPCLKTWPRVASEMSIVHYTCSNNKKEGHGGCDKEEEKVRNRVEKYMEVTS